MTLKELKKEFNLRNATGKTIENIIVIPFLLCIILSIFKFSILWLILSVLCAIAQTMVYNMNKKRWKVFLLDNKDRLSEEEKAKVKI